MTEQLPEPKNLSQFKKALKPGVCLMWSFHQEFKTIGLTKQADVPRMVKFASSSHTYILMFRPDKDKTWAVSILEFGKAKYWQFTDGKATFFEDGEPLISYEFITRQRFDEVVRDRYPDHADKLLEDLKQIVIPF